ncbi:hypothetical protein Cni_G27932 [Canna indica]|uniref:DUF641 domain-containing protein n=1 Tax=Canna indica TaxID=4628 RepID=A0AAQ3L2B3_9LILI|nr:hypothetical protein Cni_G27932 [Canna indica]
MGCATSALWGHQGIKASLISNSKLKFPPSAFALAEGNPKHEIEPCKLQKAIASLSTRMLLSGLLKETQSHDDDNNNQKASAMNQNKFESIEVFISDLFKNISSLEAAYVQLQHAHTPYNPEEICYADKLVVAELVELSQLEHKYQQTNPRPNIASPHDSCLLAEIQQQQNLLMTYQVMVKKFQSQIQIREGEIWHLQQQVQESSKMKLKLEKKLKQRGKTS